MKRIFGSAVCIVITITCGGATWAQSTDTIAVGDIVVEGDKPGAIQAPVFVVDTDHLQNKGLSSLGESLSNQIGINSTGYGAAATRPVIRGLEGARVEVMQNGMSTGDASAISNDHAVPGDGIGASQIELLRGPAALAYGSASSGGLINIRNDRIASELPVTTSVIAQGLMGSIDQSQQSSAMTESKAGSLALRADFSQKNLGNYLTPAGSRLPQSFVDQKDYGFGVSSIRDDGYFGLSVVQHKNFYGIPSPEGSKIDQTQNRYDLAYLIKHPFQGIHEIKWQVAYTDYAHDELDASSGIAQSRFTNRQLETRLDVSHDNYFGWEGNGGFVIKNAVLSAVDFTSSNASIIPSTESGSTALYWIEAKKIGQLAFNLGTRYEYQTVSPNSQSVYTSNTSFMGNSPSQPALSGRTFGLFSYSGAIDWTYFPGYDVDLTFSQLARAPSADEMFIYGAHDATATFDVGLSTLQTETSRNLEVSWKKTEGFLQAQFGVYQNNISNYIYGAMTGAVDQVSGYAIRQFTQGNAVLQGVEGQLRVNPINSSWSGRLYGDYSKGVFTDASFLPLQAAPRVGLQILYKSADWDMDVNWLHAVAQTNLASFETYSTPAYNKVDANISHKLREGSTQITLFLQGRNLLNDDIRYSTTVETLRMNAPLAGRGILGGLRIVY